MAAEGENNKKRISYTFKVVFVPDIVRYIHEGNRQKRIDSMIFFVKHDKSSSLSSRRPEKDETSTMKISAQLFRASRSWSSSGKVFLQISCRIDVTKEGREKKIYTYFYSSLQ